MSTLQHSQLLDEKFGDQFEDRMFEIIVQPFEALEQAATQADIRANMTRIVENGPVIIETLETKARDARAADQMRLHDKWASRARIARVALFRIDRALDR